MTKREVAVIADSEYVTNAGQVMQRNPTMKLSRSVKVDSYQGIALPKIRDKGLARHKRLAKKRAKAGKEIKQASGMERIGMGRDKRDAGRYTGLRFIPPKKR